MVNEIIFLVEDSPEGGYEAKALGESIFTEADSLEDLRANIKEAVLCHFSEGQVPAVIRIHYVREEVMGV
jgi:hypothetical protein